jgi:hypothetical protein
VLRTRDGRYQTLDRPGDALELAFRLPSVPEGATRTSFFYSSGYYNASPPERGQWSPRTVHAIENEAGGLSRFAVQLAREHLKLWREAPPLSRTR